jgi:hypothetical protein
MSLDIGGILDDWPFEPGQINVRRIRGDDGREKIQLRLDLGLLQMELSGRPDGRRPNGYESYLDYYLDCLESHRREHGGDERFELDERDCELLRTEGVMYYHRYLAAFVLEDYSVVVRDTQRNLRLFDLCADYAEEESDRVILEQYRPYVLMMRARAKAHLALQENRPKAALRTLRRAVEEIEALYEGYDEEEMLPQSGEVAILRAMLEDIERQRGADPVVKLQRDLAKAVDEERYEEAALLRDRLRSLTGNPYGGIGF